MGIGGGIWGTRHGQIDVSSHSIVAIAIEHRHDGTCRETSYLNLRLAIKARRFKTKVCDFVTLCSGTMGQSKGVIVEPLL